MNLTERMRRVVAATSTLSVRQFQIAVAKALEDEAKAIDETGDDFGQIRALAFRDAANAVMDLEIVEP